MSKKATEFQKREMSRMYRGKEIFKPLNTGWIDEHVACVREWVANIFFYRKGGTTIMIDAGYNPDTVSKPESIAVSVTLLPSSNWLAAAHRRRSRRYSATAMPLTLRNT